MNQNGGIHKGGFAVLCHRNGGSESPGILIIDDFTFIDIRKNEHLCFFSIEFIGVHIVEGNAESCIEIELSVL